MSKISTNLPIGRALAGFGAALVLAGPTTAFAKFCPVDFAVTSTSGTLGALQFDVDYAAATALGDLVTCTIQQSGTSDYLLIPASDDAEFGYADTLGFATPDDFARCYFEVPNNANPAPTAGNFSDTVTDATAVPGNVDVTGSTVIGVTVGDCIPSIGSCSSAPATGCKLPTTTGKSKLSFKNDLAADAKDQGQFQWKAGAATLLSEFDDPTTPGETWSWCVYDGGDLLIGKDVPSGATWLAKGTTGFQFKGDVGGIAQIKLKEGVAGKASVAVKAKSKLGNFSSPTLELSNNVVSQLVVDDGTTSVCFQSTHTAPTKNEATAYSSKD